MNIRVSRAHYPVTVLGYGKRLGIWVQGCSLACPGCLARDTWSSGGGSPMSVTALLEWCREVSEDDIDGVTISGGEPLQQAEALCEFLQALDAWRNELSREVDLLCYTGLSWMQVQREHAAVLAELDAIIPEPYVESLPIGRLVGSSNQEVRVLTDLGRRRYSATTYCANKRMQTYMDGRRVWFIGIPDRGDMQQLATLCRERGLSLADVSWNA